MSFSRPIQWYHSHADPIWPDGSFKPREICNWSKDEVKAAYRRGKMRKHDSRTIFRQTFARVEHVFTGPIELLSNIEVYAKRNENKGEMRKEKHRKSWGGTNL